MESADPQQTSSLIPNLVPVPELDGMELQNMLTDLQKKCETYKSNYQVLKNEHSSLQDELMHTQEEVKRLLAQQEKLQSQMSERSGELLYTKKENEELRLQVMTPQRLELLKVQLQQEMEVPIKERFHKLEEEAEKYRSDFNKLRYAFTMLIAQVERQKEDDAGVLEGQRMHYEVEIAHLKKEKESLVSQYKNSDQLQDRKHLEILLKEKTQLTMLVKGLQAEVAELQALKDNSDQQVENIQLTQNRQLTESHAMVKSLEAERQSLSLRAERIEGELHLSQEQSSQLTGQLHKAKREVNALTCQIDTLKLSHKTDVDNVKLEFTRSKGEVERERDTLKGQIESLKTEVEVLNEMLEKHNEVLVEKEREMVRKVKSVCEEELRKTSILHEEKLELESHLAKLEQQRLLQDTTVEAQKREWEEQLRFAQKSEESVRKELQGLKIRLKQQSSELEELERQRAELEDLKQKNQQLHVHVGALSKSQAELMETNQHLREKMAMVKEENVRRGAEQLVEDSKAREAKLEEKYSQLKDKIKRMAATQKKRKAKMEKKEKSQQDTIQTLTEQIDELNREGAAANKRLQDYQQRHSEFRSLLMSNGGSFGAGIAQAKPSCRSALFLGPEILLSNAQEDEREQKELALLRQRVDDLERVQQKQLEELGCVEQRDQQKNSLH
uniref:centrosomal protein of 83 kDa-like n=1 Tax=Doryrhamphus excisus TaxID=161450 RepID=UPI0025ADBCF9|nr:centrosomal protein of 83 kDa-like [Doryrhamphus excisus]